MHGHLTYSLVYSWSRSLPYVTLYLHSTLADILKWRVALRLAFYRDGPKSHFDDCSALIVKINLEKISFFIYMYVMIIEMIGWYNPIQLTISVSKQFSKIGDSFNPCVVLRKWKYSEFNVSWNRPIPLRI